MSKSKKVINRIIAVVLIVLGLVLGATWNHANYCIGDVIFIALGISPWSNGQVERIILVLLVVSSFWLE